MLPALLAELTDESLRRSPCESLRCIPEEPDLDDGITTAGLSKEADRWPGALIGAATGVLLKTWVHSEGWLDSDVDAESESPGVDGGDVDWPGEYLVEDPSIFPDAKLGRRG